MAAASEDKNPVGRPLRYDNVEDLARGIESYFNECDPHITTVMVEAGVTQKGETIWKQREVMTEQKPYTMSGLARSLGIDRGTLLNYSKKEDFFSTIADARSRVEVYWESALASPYANGAKFNLINNYDGWKEQTNVDHTSKGESMPMLGGVAQLPPADKKEESEDLEE